MYYITLFGSVGSAGQNQTESWFRPVLFFPSNVYSVYGAWAKAKSTQGEIGMFLLNISGNITFTFTRF